MKKVKYINVDGLKKPFFEYQAHPKDGKRKLLQKRFLKQFSKCGLYEKSAKYLKPHASTFKRWYECDEWFASELDEAFDFAVEHYLEDLETVPLQRRHALFAFHRIKYNGREMYDNNLEPITKDEYIDEDGNRQLTHSAKCRIEQEKNERLRADAEQRKQKQETLKEAELMQLDEEIEHLGESVLEYSDDEISINEYLHKKALKKRYNETRSSDQMSRV